MSKSVIARVIGAGILLGIVLAYAVNMIYLGPVVFGENYLTETYQSGFQVKLSALVELINSIISLVIIVLLVPIFLKNSKSLTYAYLSLGVFYLAVTIIDVFNVMSLYSLSKAIVLNGSSDQEVLQSMGSLLYENRWWSHYYMLLVSAFPLLLMFWMFIRTRLIPQWISYWGLLAVPFLVYALIASMFDQSTNHLLMMPLGLNQLVLAIWLLVRGFNKDI